MNIFYKYSEISIFTKLADGPKKKNSPAAQTAAEEYASQIQLDYLSLRITS